MKIVINNCFGGFGVSKDVYDELGKEWDGYGHLDFGLSCRTDPEVIAVIEKLGSEKASGFCARLKVIEIPDGIEWEIDEYDGLETVREKHRSWS